MRGGSSQNPKAKTSESLKSLPPIMNLDDLDIDAPTHAPARVSRFAPKSSKFKPKPKSETLDSAAATTSIDPQKRDESEIPAPKPESLESEAGKKEKEEDDVKPTKSESSADNGFVKMEADADTEPKDEPKDENVPMEMGDFEDTVVREIDVFYNPRVDQETQLYVFQYPLRPCWRPYELDERCQEVRVRPGSSEVELDLSMDIDSNNYDQDCGSKMKMTKQTLHCAWKEPPVSGYAVGVLMGNKLHLNPIHAAVQLRPSLKHLSSGGSKRKNGVRVEEAEEIVKTEELGGKKAAGPSKKQTKATNPVVEEKTSDGESWVPLKYQGSDTELSSKYFKSMEAQESSPVQFTMSPFDYLNTLCPGSSNKDAKAKGPSNKSLLSLPLEDRVKKYLCEGRVVHRFNALKYVAPDCTEEDLMDVLLCHAQLVQGLWVPKNSLLYTEPDKDGALRIARDYVLHSFRKSPNISFSSLHFPPSLKTAVNKFLNTFAVERPLMKDWKFKEPADNSFIKGYPDIVQKQEQIWDDVWGHIKTIFAEAKSGRGAKNVSLPSRQPQKPLNTGKVATKGAASQAVVGKNVPDDIREVLSSKVLPKVIQDHKVCSFQRICQGLRDLALNKLNLPKADPRFVKAAAYGSDSPDELRKLADHVAINIHGLYVLKSSSEHPQYDSFRNVVIGLLQENGPNAKLKKAEIFDAAKKTLNRDVTTNEYSKVMNEICTYKGSFWMLKSGDGNPK